MKYTSYSPEDAIEISPASIEISPASIEISQAFLKLACLVKKLGKCYTNKFLKSQAQIYAVIGIELARPVKANVQLAQYRREVQIYAKI